MAEASGQVPEFEPGSSIDGYTIERQIGEGGMARLYLAHDENQRRRVLKVPRRTLDVDPVAVISFENELRLARYLEDFLHAYMPVAQHAGERRYLVMDYIEGTDLWTHLRKRGCLCEAEAIALAKKIVRALAELHRRRIVHLDIKLSNIMITPEGEVRLIDFGLANHLDLPDLIYESFQEPKGTPAYIAPEQFFGVRDEPRSDLFSIGTMLYEMTTSELPFPDARSELGVISRIKRAPVSPRQYRPELSRDFATLVLTCLQNLPDRRFASMDELLTALEQIEPVSAPAATAAIAAAPVPVVASDKSMARIAGRLWRALRNAQGGNLDEIKAWIARHQSHRLSRYRIVAALDSRDDERAHALNRDILAEAVRQARLQPSIITVMTVLRDHSLAMATDERDRRELNAAYQEAREYMLRLVGSSGCGTLPVGINIRSGDPIEAIAGCVADYEADLLVIGAHERHALSRFVLGSTAYKVLTTIKCPIFVVQEAAPRKSHVLPADPAAGAGTPAPETPAAAQDADRAPASFSS